MTMRSIPIHLLLPVIGLFAFAAAAQAQGAVSAEDVAMLRDEVARLRQELGSLRAEIDTLRREGAPPVQAESGVAAGGQPEPTARALLDLLGAQVEELAQSKVESASKFPVRLSGTVLTNAFVNSSEANWLENPNLVSVPPAGTADTGTMSATARQSRVGFEIGALPVGAWQAHGTLIFDFFGGVPNFQNGPVMGLPRLLYAFGRIENGGTAIEAGQDHVMLAPRDPTSLAALAFPLFFRAGNLYLRAPQVRVEQTFGGGWRVEGGIVAPIAGDFGIPYEFAPPPGAGERSKRPAFQGRLGFARGDADAPRELTLGVSGHGGWRRRLPGLDDSWAAAVDGNARVGRVGVAGEYYIAENAEVFGGGISQPGRASGGWIEGRFALNPRTDVNGGFGLDRPKDAAGRLLRSQNRSAFGNVILRLTPEVATSFEYRWIETQSGVQLVRRANHHLNAVFAVSF